jgi:hypothetical protein
MQPVVWLAEDCIGNGICDPMPTAIVKHYTTDGFVLTADGKTSDGSLTTQKIFEIKGAPAAYALYGNSVGFGNGKDDGEPSPLHLGTETERLFNSGNLPVGDLLHCGQQLGAALNAIISKAKAHGLVVFPSRPVEGGIVILANVFLFGYSNGLPTEVHLTFWHRQQRLGDEDVRPVDPCHPPNPRVWGSPSVWNSLLSSDYRFARFGGIKLPPKPEEIGLLDAKLGENYIWGL